MKLKKFDELNENWDKNDGINPMLASRILTNLKDGFAVKVFKDSFEKFYDMIDEYGQGIELNGDLNLPAFDLQFTYADSLYFILIGKKIFTNRTPSIGGQKIEIYIPSI